MALPAPDGFPQLSEFPFANTSQPGEFIRVASVNMHGMGRWRTGDLSSINELQRAMDTQLIDIACLQETWLRPDDAVIDHLNNLSGSHSSMVRASINPRLGIAAQAEWQC